MGLLASRQHDDAVAIAVILKRIFQCRQSFGQLRGQGVAFGRIVGQVIELPFAGTVPWALRQQFPVAHEQGTTAVPFVAYGSGGAGTLLS